MIEPSQLYKKLALDYLAIPPLMAYDIEWSTKTYNAHLKCVALEDVFAYL